MCDVKAPGDNFRKFYIYQRLPDASPNCVPTVILFQIFSVSSLHHILLPQMSDSGVASPKIGGQNV